MSGSLENTGYPMGYPIGVLIGVVAKINYQTVLHLILLSQKCQAGLRN